MAPARARTDFVRRCSLQTSACVTRDKTQVGRARARPKGRAMAIGRRLSAFGSVTVAAIIVACSPPRPGGEEPLGWAPSERGSDASDAPHDARGAQSNACRSITLRAHHERCEHGRHHHGDEDADAEVTLAPPLTFAIP